MSPLSHSQITPDDFRRRFLRKLAYSKVWVPQVHRSPKHQTVIIFDWDDTLLCTTWLKQCSQSLRRAEYEEPLCNIADRTRSLLETAVEAGFTYIITNAMPGWVEHSAAKWIPELLPTLRKVPVISARAKFEPTFPGDVKQWKVQAFLEIQRQMNAEPITNLVALGDTNFEMEAARIMGGEFEEGLVKTVKFRPKAAPHELLKQLEYVANNLGNIVRSAQNQKVILGSEQKQL